MVWRKDRTDLGVCWKMARLRGRNTLPFRGRLSRRPVLHPPYSPIVQFHPREIDLAVPGFGSGGGRVPNFTCEVSGTEPTVQHIWPWVFQATHGGKNVSKEPVGEGRRARPGDRGDQRSQ